MQVAHTTVVCGLSSTEITFIACKRNYDSSWRLKAACWRVKKGSYSCTKCTTQCGDSYRSELHNNRANVVQHVCTVCAMVTAAVLLSHCASSAAAPQHPMQLCAHAVPLPRPHSPPPPPSVVSVLQSIGAPTAQLQTQQFSLATLTRQVHVLTATQVELNWQVATLEMHVATATNEVEASEASTSSGTLVATQVDLTEQLAALAMHVATATNEIEASEASTSSVIPVGVLPDR